MVACSAGSSPSVTPSGSPRTLGSTVVKPSSVSSSVGSPTYPASVDLRSATNCAVLAGSTAITGNVGIFPGTARTGFLSGVINGDFHAAEGTSQQAELDLQTAYGDAMGRVANPLLIAGNLGGQTLTPGLYKSSSSLEVSSGDLYPDAGGDPNAIFVFQMASTFNMTTGRSIFLTNGTKPGNIFWAVGSSATIGTGCSFYGNLLVYASISIATGSVMTGRALRQVGAVTMQSNTIVMPPQ